MALSKWEMPKHENMTKVYCYAMVPCGLGLVGGAVYSLYKRHQKAERLRVKHEAKIMLWVDKQDREQQLKEEFQRERSVMENASMDTQPEDICRYRVDSRLAWRLWEDGCTLRCSPQVLQKLVVLMVEEWRIELEECLEFLDTNFTYEQKMKEIVAKVEATRAGHMLMPLWTKVKQSGKRSWRRNIKQFLKLMLVGTRVRMVSVLTTAGFSVLLAQIANEQSCCREGLLRAITCCATTTAQELLYWFARDLWINYLNGFVSYMGEALNTFLVKQSSILMWRRFYTQLVSFDSEIYDQQDVANYLNLEDAIYDAEAAIQTCLQCAMDLGTRLIMIYSRGGLRLTTCVLAFWSCSYAVKAPLEKLKAMLAKQDYVGRHDDDEELDNNADWEDEDAVKDDMKSLFEHIKTVRSFGRDQEMMQALVKKKLGTGEVSLFNLDEFLGYCFPPVKDWVIVSLELLCRFTCAKLLRWGLPLPCTEQDMHILIKETWNALGTAPNSLNPKFVLNHITQVATVMNILDYAPTIEKPGGLRPDALRGVIELVNVSFAYPTRRDRKVLSNLSFKAEPGTLTGLVGPSGSGKSTVFGLLMRFYDPCEGRVLLDGRDLRDYDVAWLRQRIGEVTQSTELFAMSVEDNIKFGCKDATRDQVVHAAKLANAYNFVMSLPEGFNTVLGDSALRLSGGQMQRIAIARAFLSRPRILLLDEYSSALDTQSEVEVQQALARLVEGGCTAFAIAHRLQTVEHAARIVVLDRGTCVESGTHSELLAHSDGVYTHLDSLQRCQSSSPNMSPLVPPEKSFAKPWPAEPPRKPKRASFQTVSLTVMTFNSLMKESKRRACREETSSVAESASVGSGALRLMESYLTENYGARLALLDQGVLHSSWERVVQRDKDGVFRDVATAFLDAADESVKEKVAGEDVAAVLEALIRMMVFAGLSTDRWFKEASSLWALGFSQDDVAVLRSAWLSTLHEHVGEDLTARHQRAWDLGFEIVGGLAADLQHDSDQFERSYQFEREETLYSTTG